MAEPDYKGTALRSAYGQVPRISNTGTGPKVRTPVGDAPVIPLALIAIGFYIMWFAVRYWRDADLTWPSDPVKSILQGHGLPGRTPAATTTAILSTAISTAQSEAPAVGGAASGAGAGSYSHSQLTGLWRLQGGPAATADVAAAIAQAESRGDARITSPNPDGGVNVGLWQLDTKGKGSGHTVAELQNPAINAKVAIAGSDGGRDWSAWATFTSGAYIQFLAGGQAGGVKVTQP